MDEILIPAGIREYLPEGIKVIREVIEEPTGEGGGTPPPARRPSSCSRRTREVASSTSPIGHLTG
jgi:hypothetical protein